MQSLKVLRSETAVHFQGFEAPILLEQELQPAAHYLFWHRSGAAEEVSDFGIYRFIHLRQEKQTIEAHANIAVACVIT